MHPLPRVLAKGHNMNFGASLLFCMEFTTRIPTISLMFYFFYQWWDLEFWYLKIF